MRLGLFITKVTILMPLPPVTLYRVNDLLPVKNKEVRLFYEQEAIRGGWSKRQLIRQINTQFYERTLLSRNKGAMPKKGQRALAPDKLTPEEEIKAPSF
jgi:predicted nuclease of restriction endonuclease-like (RecB) superfamily